MTARGETGMTRALCGACGRQSREHDGRGDGCAGFVVGVTPRSAALRALLEGVRRIDPELAEQLGAEGLAVRTVALDRWGWVLAAEACAELHLEMLATWMWDRRLDRIATAAEMLDRCHLSPRWEKALDRVRALLPRSRLGRDDAVA